MPKANLLLDIRKCIGNGSLHLHTFVVVYYNNMNLTVIVR